LRETDRALDLHRTSLRRNSHSAKYRVAA